MDKLFDFFQRNQNVYKLWWESKQPFTAYECKVASQEQLTQLDALSEGLDNADASTYDKYGFTLLHYAVWHNFSELASRLIELGADVNAPTKETTASTMYTAMEGAAPLHIACYLGNLKMVKLLLEAGADTQLKDNFGKAPIHYLMLIRGHEHMFENVYAQWHVTDQKAAILPLLEGGINVTDDSGNTPLITLLSGTYIPAINALTEPMLKLGASAYKRDVNGNTPLMLAAKNGAITAALLLYENDKDSIDLTNNDGDTALHIAVNNSKGEIAYFLLDMGADTDKANNNGESCRTLIEKQWDENLKKRLQGKRAMKKEDVLQLMKNTFFRCRPDDNDAASFGMYLANKIIKELDEDDDDDISLLFNLIDSSNQEDICVQLVEAVYKGGFDFTASYALRSASETLRDHMLKPGSGAATVRKMAELGIDMDSAIIKGKTPVYIIAEQPVPQKMPWNMDKEDFDAVTELFSVDSMEALSEAGTTAIHMAAKNDHVLMLEKMIEMGADINIAEDAPGIIGATPLHQACIVGNTEIVKMLKKAGADDSLTTKDGETPAHFIAREMQRYKPLQSKTRIEIINALTNVDEGRNDGKTPLMLAQLLDYNTATDLSMALLDKNVDVNKTDNAGNTALLLHIDNICNKDLVKEMIKVGADVNAKNAAGNTPLHLALKRNNDMVGRLLIKKGADYKTPNGKGETPMDIAVSKGMEVVLELMDLT